MTAHFGYFFFAGVDNWNTSEHILLDVSTNSTDDFLVHVTVCHVESYEM